MNNPLLRTLRNRSFFFLWIAEVFSQVAMNMMNFVLILVAFSLTSSNTAVSGIVLSFTIPAIFFGILAGVFVDRWDKKYVLFATNAIRAVLLVILAFAHTNLFGLYALTFVISIITQFFIPAETPMIPLLVKKEQLLTANALFSVALYGSVLVAYALSGPFLIYFGPRNAFFLLAALFLLGMVATIFIKASKPKKVLGPQLSKAAIATELHETFKLVAKVKNLYHAFLLLALSQILILIIAVVGPGFAKQVLHISIDTFPLIFVTPAVIGMGVGTFILTNYFHHVSKQKCATAGLFLSSVAVFLLPLASRFISYPYVQSFNSVVPHLLQFNVLHFMIFLAFLLGIANALIFVPSKTIIQEETSDEMRGKIYGGLNTVVSLLSLLPVALVGSLADIIGVNVVLMLVAVGIAIIGVVRLFLV
jgi:MFS family permease